MMNNKGEILILNHYDRLSARLLLEVKALYEAGYQVRVLLWNRSKERTDIPFEVTGVRWEQVIVPAPSYSLGLLWYLPRLYLAFARKAANATPSVVHCTHLFLLPLAIGMAKRFGAKVVYDAFEFYALDIAYYYNFGQLAGLVRRCLEGLENWLVSHVHAVLTVSTASDVLAQRYRRYAPKVQTLLNVPDLQVEGHSDLVDSDSVETVVPEQRFIVVYSGGIQRNKGVLVAIEALRLVLNDFPQTTLYLIGEVKDSKVDILDLIQTFQLNSHVRLIGAVPYHLLLPLLKKAQVGLALYQPEGHFPLTGAGGPRKIFDYMQARLPVVAPSFGGFEQIIGQVGCGVLVDTSKPREVADAIRTLLQNPSLRLRMGTKGRQAVEEKYNWGQEKHKLLDLYASLHPAHAPLSGLS